MTQGEKVDPKYRANPPATTSSYCFNSPQHSTAAFLVTASIVWQLVLRSTTNSLGHSLQCAERVKESVETFICTRNSLLKCGTYVQMKWTGYIQKTLQVKADDLG